MTRSNASGSIEKLGRPPPRNMGGKSQQPRPGEARMRTNSRRRGRGLALAVIAVSASLPQMAWAQQTGLFPLHPIKRHRVPCDHEDPIYKINKYQYFGAFPTCWRRFPEGWGCPSADAPDREKSFKETPLGSQMGAPGAAVRGGTRDGKPASQAAAQSPGDPRWRAFSLRHASCRARSHATWCNQSNPDAADNRPV